MNDAGTNQTDLFTRSGHISELTLDRWDLDELTALEEAGLEAHLAQCEACRLQRQTVASFDAATHLAPPSRTPRTVPLPATTRRRARAGGRAQSLWMAGAAVLTAAAAVALFVVPTQPSLPEDDGIRRKGTGMDLEVFVDREDRLSLSPGDTVHPGERLGFRVHVRDAGHIMIVGIDQSREPYLCYPQHSGGAAVATDSMTRAGELTDAVELDEVLGQETLLLVRCDAPFTFEGVRDQLPSVPTGCQKEELRIVKTRR